MGFCRWLAALTRRKPSGTTVPRPAKHPSEPVFSTKKWLKTPDIWRFLRCWTCSASNASRRAGLAAQVGPAFAGIVPAGVLTRDVAHRTTLESREASPLSRSLPPDFAGVSRLDIFPGGVAPCCDAPSGRNGSCGGGSFPCTPARTPRSIVSTTSARFARRTRPASPGDYLAGCGCRCASKGPRGPESTARAVCSRAASSSERMSPMRRSVDGTGVPSASRTGGRRRDVFRASAIVVIQRAHPVRQSSWSSSCRPWISFRSCLVVYRQNGHHFGDQWVPPERLRHNCSTTLGIKPVRRLDSRPLRDCRADQGRIDSLVPGLGRCSLSIHGISRWSCSHNATVASKTPSPVTAAYRSS